MVLTLHSFFFILYFTFQICIVDGLILNYASAVNKKDKILDVSILLTRKINTRLGCIKLCSLNSKCTAINYGDSTCDLIDLNVCSSTHKELQYKKGYVYIEMAQTKEELTSLKSEPCKMNGICSQHCNEESSSFEVKGSYLTYESANNDCSNGLATLRTPADVDNLRLLMKNKVALYYIGIYCLHNGCKNQIDSKWIPLDNSYWMEGEPALPNNGEVGVLFDPISGKFKITEKTTYNKYICNA